MGCASSKDNVQSIEIQDGKVRKKSGKKIKVVSSDESLVNDSNATLVGPKSKSAKSRDSGIGEMEYGRNPNDMITEESDPNRIEDVENENRPKTPDLSLVGHQFQSRSAGRAKSKAILEELEAEGLISGSKIEKGGSAFEVRLGPLQPLEPLAPLGRPPPRLERMKSEKKLPSKAELEEKMKLVEDRRKEKLQRRSRLASQLSRDQAMAAKLQPEPNDENDENLADNIDIVTSTTTRKVDHGQGEGLPTRTIFDEKSLNSIELNSPGVTDSTDAFFKEIIPSNESPFS